MRVVRSERLGAPQTSRDAFVALAETRILGADLAQALMRVVGFRNVAVHEYRALDVVRAVATRGLSDVEAFGRWMVMRASV